MSHAAPFGSSETALRLDARPGKPRPSNAMVVVATAVSLAGSLAIDVLLVHLGTALFPVIKGNTHFRFSDYVQLTIVGVVFACCAWPVTTRITSAPRRLFLRLALVVTVVLWLPDLWLLLRHQPVDAVGVLMTMHLAIALVTYNALVRIAPPRQRDPVGARSDLRADGAGGTATEVEDADEEPWLSRKTVWIVMAVTVGVEFALGLAALILVPEGRPSELVPSQGLVVYGAHAVIGGLLVIGAVILALTNRQATRMVRIAVVTGLVGILVGGAGGLLATSHPLRLLGIALMFAGAMTGGFGYLVAVLEPAPAPAPAPASEP